MQILPALCIRNWHLGILPAAWGGQRCPHSRQNQIKWPNFGCHFLTMIFLPFPGNVTCWRRRQIVSAKVSLICCQIKTQLPPRHRLLGQVFQELGMVKMYLFYNRTGAGCTLEGITKPASWERPTDGASFYPTDLINVRNPVGPSLVVPLTPRKRMNKAATLSTRRR